MAAFCASCGSKVNTVDKFCFKCGSRVANLSLNNENNDLGISKEQATSSKVKTLSQYMASKSEDRVGFNKQNKQSKRKATNKGPLPKKAADNRVIINIGIISENEEGNLAVKRASRLAVKVSKDFSSDQVRTAAIRKHADHDQFFSTEYEYVLLFPDQKLVKKVPGSDVDFTVAKYKHELAKPYSKCDLYLCKVTEFVQTNKSTEDEKENEELSIVKSEPKELNQEIVDVPSDDDSFLKHSVFDDSEMFPDDFHNFSEHTMQCSINTPTTSSQQSLYSYLTPQARSGSTLGSQSFQNVAPVVPVQNISGHEGVKVECPTCHGHFLSEEIGFHADLCAESAHRQAFFEAREYLPPDDIPDGYNAADVVSDGYGSTPKTDDNDLPLSEIMSLLMDRLEPHSRINVRRGKLFADYMETRKRCDWLQPENKLKVVFIGEPAEDTGGPRREFFTEVLKEVRGRLFTNGVPITSTSAIAENEFRYAGNLAAASIIQGGPPPCFLKKWVYQYIVSGLCEELELSANDLALSEMKSFVNKLLQCPSDEEVQALLSSDEGVDVLLSISSRVVPSKSNLQTRDKIVRAILIRDIVQERLPMVSQFMEGLKTCGLLESIQKYPEQLKPLFCIDVTTEELDEDSFTSLFTINFSLEQQKKMKEVDTYKVFSDYIGMVSHSVTRGVKLSDILQFTTGAAAIPAMGFAQKLQLSFVHGCSSTCKCFPTSSTCDLLLRIPVHLMTIEEMQSSFHMALKDGSVFGVV